MQQVIELIQNAKEITQPIALAALLYLGLVGLVALVIPHLKKMPPSASTHRLLQFLFGMVAMLALFILIFAAHK